MRCAEPVGQTGDPAHDGRQQTRRRGARNLEAIRHRQFSYVSIDRPLRGNRIPPDVKSSWGSALCSVNCPKTGE
ncbi:hypothetical protein GCM10017557_12450 [Streptomyces aurantiacus]|uniref:Uncharacterized protein n=1 Tax=Streptomyces aurantiacus TaxID=47760 RepID=A0A7G1NXW9_9ACTN|nr:hypothetical protein GCM10017557_12450 [Streptomyces aurantiacus]